MRIGPRMRTGSRTAKLLRVANPLSFAVTAVLNALAHERAVAWAERKEKDASKEVMGPDSETAKAAADINNQAAYLVCRRIACC